MHDMHIAYDLGNSLTTLDDASHGNYGEADNATKEWWLNEEGEQPTGSFVNAKNPYNLKLWFSIDNKSHTEAPSTFHDKWPPQYSTN